MAPAWLKSDPKGCPYLFLAPMEGVGDRCFRKAMAFVGGMDRAVTEFIRVPREAHVKSLAKVYLANELSSFPLTAQIMGGEPDLMAEMALELEKRGADHIDINCGCPSNTVTGRGAGSSLLKDPRHLYEVAKSVKTAINIPLSLKLRSGFDDTSLFEENLLAAQEAGSDFITLHPRTKREGYKPPARWDLIAKAKKLLSIPVIGNGDINTVEDAFNILEQTKCDGLMIGRGALMNPFIFQQIRAQYHQKTFTPSWELFEAYLKKFVSMFPVSSLEKHKVNKLKQLTSFLCSEKAPFAPLKKSLLSLQVKTSQEYLNHMLNLFQTIAF